MKSKGYEKLLLKKASLVLSTVNLLHQILSYHSFYQEYQFSCNVLRTPNPQAMPAASKVDGQEGEDVDDLLQLCLGEG
jgi:hypothetical protein